MYTTSEQHKEATASRMESDSADLAILATKLEQHSPFLKETTLQNIVTGIIADKFKTFSLLAETQLNTWKDNLFFHIPTNVRIKSRH